MVTAGPTGNLLSLSKQANSTKNNDMCARVSSLYLNYQIYNQILCISKEWKDAHIPALDSKAKNDQMRENQPHKLL